MHTNKQGATGTLEKLRKPALLHRNQWASDSRLWKGFFQGKDIGTEVTVLFFTTEESGVGPSWHVHTYDEIFFYP